MDTLLFSLHNPNSQERWSGKTKGKGNFDLCRALGPQGTRSPPVAQHGPMVSMKRSVHPKGWENREAGQVQGRKAGPP